MRGNKIDAQFTHMSDEALIRATTVQRSDYSEEFHEAAQNEIRKRGLDPATAIEAVGYSFNTGESETITIKEALKRLDVELTIWDALFFTSILNETFMIQRESSFWTIHHFLEEGYEKSFFAREKPALQETLEKFLRLEEWEGDISEEFQMDRWSIVLHSDSQRYVAKVAEALDKSSVLFTIKNANFSRFDARFGNYYNESGLNILVPDRFSTTAKTVLREIEASIEKLYEAAREYGQSGDARRELETYDALVQLVPDDMVLYFNRGVLQYNAGDEKGAGESFTEAILSDDPSIREESRIYLEKLLEKFPDNTNVLHTLANHARYNGEVEQSINYYKFIITVDKDDPLAHLNLGFLYYEQEGEDKLVSDHFNRYLELMPAAENRSDIEQILSSLT